MEGKPIARPGATAPLELMSSPDACDGCGECVASCLAARGGRGAGIRVVAVGDRCVPIVCHNCEDAPCVAACMPGCRHRDEASGRIVTDYERCIGCWMCVMLCPFGAIQRIPSRDGEPHGVALKCDGCLDQADAPCVAACKPRGLEEVDPLAVAREKRLTAARQFVLFGDEP